MDLSVRPPHPHDEIRARRGRCHGALLISIAAIAAIAAATNCGPAAGAAAPGDPAAMTPPAAAPRAAAPPATGDTVADQQERVLNVILVPPGRLTAPPAGAGAPVPAGRLAVMRNRHPPVGGSTGSARRLWLGLAAVAALLAAGWLAWRRRPPRCGNCGAATRRLSADAAFAELDMAERTEQLVGDVRYTVWRCAACGGIEKGGVARDLSGLIADATAPPVGSAAFLRRRTQSGLSIWSPPAGGGAPSPSPRKPFADSPKALQPTMLADEPRPGAPSGDAERR